MATKEPSPLTVACPLPECSAPAGEPCRRFGKVTVIPHAWRLTEAWKVAGYVRKPLPGEKAAQRFLDAATGQKRKP